MGAKTSCRLLVDPPAEGTWNMALDEALLNASLESQLATLRFYQWSRPTLSLGYFQRYEDRTGHLASQIVPVVRRLSGGGAILHDREVTYSLSLPASHHLASDTQALYDALHATLIEFLQGAILQATPSWKTVRCASPSKSPASQVPFLCFERRFLGDILLLNEAAPASRIEHKIVGSAQRRRRGGVLQHGSILLSRSPMAPELSGIQEITRIAIHPEDLFSALPDALAHALNLDLQTGPMPNDLRNLAQKIQREKYEVDTWTQRR
ncbi:MAG: lipoate--protein ligase family protein [Pirellulales bacterium]|nr:lipoate--protein ligase family protein [Pirellulales bacterium]